MRGTVIILCLSLGTLAERTSTSGNATNARPKIVGGRPVDIRYRPFMLSLHGLHGFRCGASVLSKTWGITALHCLESVLRSRYFYVRAGSNRIYRGGSLHRITNIQTYNDTYYPLGIPMHDIALFEVRPPFHFSRIVQPIRLPKSTDEPPHMLVVCGWGDTSVGGSEAQTLMGTIIERVPFETCAKIPQYTKLIRDDHHLCYGAQGRDACYGDSGGALADRHTIHGIVSFGHSCGVVPGVYVRVSYYRQWILNIVESLN